MSQQGQYKPKKKWWVPTAFLAPAVLTLFAITIFPLIYSVIMSLHDVNLGSWGGWNFVGLENFQFIFKYDGFFRESARVTAIFVVAAVAIQFLAGLGIALLLNRELKGAGLIRTILILPTMMTPVVAGLIWRLMYNPDLGMVNYLFSLVGLPMNNWLGNPSTALWAVLVADTWQWTPFMAIVLLAGLHALPNEPYEAAKVDGASTWMTFRYVTLPLLRPTILVAILIRLIDAFKTFDIIFVLTQGGPGMSTEILSLYTYRNGFKFFNMGYAAALAFVMLAAVVIVSQVLVRLLAREEAA